MKKVYYYFISMGVCGLFLGCEQTENRVEPTYYRDFGEPCNEIDNCSSDFICSAGFCRILCQEDNDCPNKKQHCGADKYCVDNIDGTCRTGWSGVNCDICEDKYYGSNCLLCPDCGSHGICSDGLDGDGTCQCDTGWAGSRCADCDSTHFGAKCEECPDCGSHGVCDITSAGEVKCACSEGFIGDHCESCSDPRFTGVDCNACFDSKYSGPNCDECYDKNYTGKNCDVPITCKHGTLDVNTGICSECNNMWQGVNCDTCPITYTGTNCNIPVTCKHGTLNTTTGQCSDCDNEWQGVNCDTCPITGYGDKCVACTRPNGTYDKASAADCRLIIDNETYQVVDVDGYGHIWMAENLRNAGTNSIIPKQNGAEIIKWGRLYGNYNEQLYNLCPDGWILPTTTDVNYLLTAIDGVCSTNTSGGCSSTPLRPDTWNNGTNRIGFSAQPSGLFVPRYQGSDYSNSGNYTTASFGSASWLWYNNGANSGYMTGCPGIHISDEKVTVSSSCDTDTWYAVRCVRWNRK